MKSRDEVRRELLRSEVEDVKVKKGMSVSELIRLYRDSHGFTASSISRAVDILYEMVADDNARRFLAFTANIAATGLRGLLAQVIREGFFDVVITTCGTIDHDIARSFGGAYYKGSFDVDDRMLHELDIHRLGNIYIPVESYGPLIERVVSEIVPKLVEEKKEWGVRELLERVGMMIEDENSILRAAADRGVPVYVPGIVDGAFGTQLFIQSQFTGLKIDLFKDMKELADIVFTSKKTGALIVGGGISKHHTIWWNQFKGGLDYAVYVTTAVEYDGSLSGARPREAVSWGKIRPEAKSVVVYGDATVVLPILFAALIDRVR